LCEVFDFRSVASPTLGSADGDVPMTVRAMKAGAVEGASRREPLSDVGPTSSGSAFNSGHDEFSEASGLTLAA
jgi:hypothetical protein